MSIAETYSSNADTAVTTEAALVLASDRRGTGQSEFTDMSEVILEAERLVGGVVRQIPEDGIFDPKALSTELIRTAIEIANMAHKLGFKEGLDNRAG